MPIDPNAVNDPLSVVCCVEALTQDGNTVHIPWGSLTWEQNPNEIASRASFTVPDMDAVTINVDGTKAPCVWIGSYLGRGTPILVNAGLPGALSEQFRGVIDGVARGLDLQAPLTITCYDPLHDFLDEQVNAWYPAGTTGNQVITDQAGQWSIPLGQVTGLDVPLTSPLRYIGKSIGDVFTDVIDQTRALTPPPPGVFILRWNASAGPDGTGAMEVVPQGTNGTVLLLQTGVQPRKAVPVDTGGQGNDSILGGQESLTRPSVTRVKVYQVPATGTPEYNAYLQPTDTGSQSYQGPGVLVLTQDGQTPSGASTTAMGVRQAVIQGKRGWSDDDALNAALAVLNGPKGQPGHQVTLIAPLVPGVQRGDLVQVSAGLMDGADGQLYVNGLSCDALARTMTLQLVLTPAELEAESESLSDSPVDTSTDQDSASRRVIPSPGANTLIGSVLSAATAVQGSTYQLGGPEGRTLMDQPSAFTHTDCSGFVTWAYYIGSNGAIDLRSGRSTSTATLYPQTQPISGDQAQPGDLVFYNMDQGDMTKQHVALYLGNGQIVQDGGNQNVVNVASIDQAIGSAPEYRRLTRSLT